MAWKAFFKAWYGIVLLGYHLCPLQVAPPSFTWPICKYARLHMLIPLTISCTMTVPDSVDAVNVYRSNNLVQAVKVDSAQY